MEHNQQKKGGGLSTGFLLGVVVGVIVTLLLTTKRGKRILKMITEEGISKISNWEDMFSDMVEEYQSKPAEPKLPPVELAQDVEEEDELAVMQSEKEKHPVLKKEPKPIKRFFKGIHRSSVN